MILVAAPGAYAPGTDTEQKLAAQAEKIMKVSAPPLHSILSSS